jgi:hypothetical protein
MFGSGRTLDAHAEALFQTRLNVTKLEREDPLDLCRIANWVGDGFYGPAPNQRYANVEVGPFKVDTTFPKGQAFLKWLQYVGATTSDTLELIEVLSDVTTVNKGAQRWIYTPPNGGTPEFDRYISFGTPVGGVPSPPDAGPDAGPSYCGKAVFSDLHVAQKESRDTLPTTCNGTPWAAQEKALEFLFFDLSACVQDDTKPPPTPVPGPIR